jgi:hypothetical protein
MTRIEVVNLVWLPAYLHALGRGHDTIRARDIARTAVTDYYEETRRAEQAERQLAQQPPKRPTIPDHPA